MFTKGRGLCVTSRDFNILRYFFLYFNIWSFMSISVSPCVCVLNLNPNCLMYRNAVLSDILYGIVMLCGVPCADVAFCGVPGPGAACGGAACGGVACGGVACSGVACSVATSGIVACDSVTCGSVVAGTGAVSCGVPCVVTCGDVFSILIYPCGELCGCQDISLVRHLSKECYMLALHCLHLLQ